MLFKKKAKAQASEETQIAVSEKQPSLIKRLHARMATFFGRHPAIMAITLSVLVAFVGECFNRQSIIKALIFLVQRPFHFLCNASIIMVFEAFALLFKKRNFLMWFFSLVWFGLGVTTFVMSFFRITPFNANDFVMIKSVFPILPTYLTWPGVIACGIFLLCLFIFLFILWVRAKKIKVRYTYAAVTFLSSVVAAVLLIGTGYLSGMIPGRFPNLPDAYRDHGFTFCFSVTIVDRGIDKPKNYEDQIDEIVSDVLETDPPSSDSAGDQTPISPEELPNVIIVQLESFCDMKLYEGFAFSKDPTPVFTELKENYTHGYLTVPSIGAGTANTEFEVLCGMSLKYFGAGEYPYETILQKSTNESICFNLKNYGYTAHAVHNYKANFYDRNNVYAKLGFDTFTSIEYMNSLEYNQIGWAKDAVLVDYVTAALTSTEGHDLVYCVTVQGHGKYPLSSYAGEDKEPITITSYPEDANKHSFNYYVNQLHETDAFIGALIASVEAMEENTVIVFFGDHLPNIGMEEDWVKDGVSLYETEYVIWQSSSAKQEDEDLTSYQLSAKVMELLGLNDGVMTHLHQKKEEMSQIDYELYLHMLQYDILYGDCNAYGGELPFEETDLKMGVYDITVTGAYPFGENSYIKGRNFTKSSKIFVNGTKKDTEFLDDNTLILSGIRLEAGDKIKVVQLADGIFHIGATEVFVYEEDEE